VERQARIAAEVRAGDRDAAEGVERAARERERGPLDVVAQLQIERTGGGEVAVPREVGPLGDLDPLHQLGDHEVEIGVALPVAVADQVDRDAVHEHRHVGAVIGVEAAEEVLVRLAAAGVLHDVEPGDDLEDVGGTRVRAQLEVAIADRARRGGGARARGARGGAEGRARVLQRRLGRRRERCLVEHRVDLGVGRLGLLRARRRDEQAHDRNSGDDLPNVDGHRKPPVRAWPAWSEPSRSKKARLRPSAARADRGGGTSRCTREAGRRRCGG
jgi:hypothetical protein